MYKDYCATNSLVDEYFSIQNINTLIFKKLNSMYTFLLNF